MLVNLNKKCSRPLMNSSQSKDIRIRNLWNQQDFFFLFWLWNMHPKQWMLWISSWLLELIIKTVILITTQKCFFFKYIALIFSLIKTTFLSSILSLKNAKHLKKISEELIPAAWRPSKWWNSCKSEDKKKGIEPIFTEGL